MHEIQHLLALQQNVISFHHPSMLTLSIVELIYLLARLHAPTVLVNAACAVETEPVYVHEEKSNARAVNI